MSIVSPDMCDWQLLGYKVNTKISVQSYLGTLLLWSLNSVLPEKFCPGACPLLSTCCFLVPDSQAGTRWCQLPHESPSLPASTVCLVFISLVLVTPPESIITSTKASILYQSVGYPKGLNIKVMKRRLAVSPKETISDLQTGSHLSGWEPGFSEWI